MEDYALGTGPSLNDAATKDVQIKSSKEECALSMGQRLSFAVVMDAQIKS